ncbi:hypothetical protein [Prevotella sp. S7-1-8]|uniref:hypothetical protein n=1 Tax=Prevotella sp. S7-1-8 TaxID=1284775 RepID=UPI0018CFA081|nr:hypothetical protein [Prevotella sp. S7-1-8]
MVFARDPRRLFNANLIKYSLTYPLLAEKMLSLQQIINKSDNRNEYRFHICGISCHGRSVVGNWGNELQKLSL